MQLEQEWDSSKSVQKKLLTKYHAQRGGVLLHAVDVCQDFNGGDEQRSTNLLVSNLTDEYEQLDGEAFVYTESDRDRIRQLVETPSHDVELLEAKDWGYDGFGRIVAKSELLERFWDVGPVQRTWILDTSASNPFLRTEPPDDEMMQLSREFNIHIVDGKTLEPR